MDIATGLAANVLASVLVKGVIFLIKEIKQSVEFKAKAELEKLERQLEKAKRLFDNMKTTETWQCETADVLRVFYDIEDLVHDAIDASDRPVLQEVKRRFKGKSGSTREKIKELRERLEEIIEGLELGNRAQQQEQHCQQGVNEVPDPAGYLLGRKEEKEEIIRLLLDDTISSVSIVGIGGLGKTELAFKILSDTTFGLKFWYHRWVPVTAKFDLKAVTEYMLNDRLEIEDRFLHGEILVSFKRLRAEKSALIVVDGLQNVTVADWILFSSCFPPASAGCKFLITTRNPRVALTTGATPYHLPWMKASECQDLVINIARNVNRLSGRPLAIMEKNAKAIAKMSKGLPLAAIVLGQYLSSECREHESVTLSNEGVYHTKEYKEEIFPVLKLNTENMRSQLYKCLAYSSLFPRDYHFNRDSLVQLWMAEGFVLREATRNLLEIGIEYFDDLYDRSFFQPSQLGEHEISSYKMHDFIHRFVESVAPGICFRLEDIDQFSPERWCNKVRHLSLLCDSIQLYLEKIEQCDGLRTILLPNEQRMIVGKIPYSFFKNLKRLRVLDLSKTDITEIPGSLVELKFLRYLDLSETLISSLLVLSISKLRGLQVLNLRGCTNLSQLPNDLYTLTSLSHLEVDIQHLEAKPASVGRLIHLQTLPTFFVGGEEGKRITELKNLNSLRGTLKLFELENVEDEAEAREAELCEKQSLTRLELEWSSAFADESKATVVFAGLEPHDHVKELKVTHYVGSSFPSWLTSQSCLLKSIHVQDSLLDDALPTLGQLPFLKNLHLEKMHRVMHMRNPVCGDGNSVAFSSLKSLTIKDMEHLTSWHELPNNCMQELTDLTIEDCPILSSMPSLKPIGSLKTLEINRCPVLEALPRLPSSVQLLIIFESDIVKQRCQPQGPELHMIRSIPRVEIDGIIIDFDEIDYSRTDSVVGLARFRYKLSFNLYCCLVLAFAFVVKLFWF